MSLGTGLAFIVPDILPAKDFFRRLQHAGMLPELRPLVSYQASSTLPRVDIHFLPAPHSLDADAVVHARSVEIDVITIPAILGEKGAQLVVTDVDSTLIEQEVIEEIAHYAGTRDEVRRVTERAMNGELDFAQSLRERVATLRGVSAQVLADVSRSITLTHGADTLIDALHRSGGFFGIVSGGFEEIVAPLAMSLRIDHYCANRLEVRSGVLTGRVHGNIVTADTKVAMLRTWARDHGIQTCRTVAIGDGANDIPMMQEAGLGVAFCAKPAVRERVSSHLSLPRLDVMSFIARPLLFDNPT